MFTTKYTKQKGKLPRPLAQRFAEGGRVGPFDKYLSHYDKFERSENVEDRTRDNIRAATTTLTAEDGEKIQRYFNAPAKVTKLGADAGLHDISSTPLKDESPSFIKLTKKKEITMSDIKVFPQDKPISVVTGGPDASMPYGVVNVHGMRIAQFATEEEARACADEANKSEEESEPEQPEPEIESEPEPEPDTEAIETPQQKHDTKPPRAARKKAVTKTKGRTMPRGIPKKKKAAVKKRAKSVAKKVVQKVMKRRKKKKAL